MLWLVYSYRMKRKVCEREGCGNPVWSKGMCKWHVPKKMPENKNSGNNLKRSSLRKKSAKRKVQEDEYSKKRKKHLEVNPKCVSCGSIADQVHHRLQIRYGRFLNDESQFLSVCGPCHRHIHDNVEFSVEMGYLASKEEKAKYLRENL